MELNIIKNEDIFLNKQPEKKFVELLCEPVHKEKPTGFKPRKLKDNEVLFDKVNLIFDFVDDENLLEYAYKDFKDFLNSAEITIDEQGKKIQLTFDENLEGEDFILDVDKTSCKIYSGKTEGIRRALIFIEDEMKRHGGPILEKGKIKKTPFVKTRISRCFFTPPSHSSNDGISNELMDDIDYYPEEYLNRLAHDGINGLWIGTTFRSLLKSEIIKEYGFAEEKQIKKLNETIKRCKKFGIDIYLFVTEPASECGNKNILNYPEMLGGIGYSYRLVCPATEMAERYINESITRLFTLAPDLAGLIDITTGESLSSCGSYFDLNCPRCKEKYKTLGKTLSATEDMIVKAMKKVAPKAKFISWTYEHRAWSKEEIKNACNSRNPDVIQMQNFEDNGRPIQLGKKRLAYDYWLSYAGPGEVMKYTTKLNMKRNLKTFAKIQVCSSHEISTVPYVPAPGILYDKYKYIYNNDISGVLQCWYFGNYPCMMNKSAYELSCLPFYKNKDEFLIDLAKTYFGNDYENAVKAWKLFEKGYKNFPVNLAFEWIGPMQDSPCVPLHLLPADWPMPGTWIKTEQSGGDRIGECLQNGHTIDEALILVGRMNDCWAKGLKYLEKLDDENNSDRHEQVSNAMAIKYIFNSGYNILRFYKLRHLLGTKQGEPKEILNKMKDIVYQEIENSKALIPITENDRRIGYHSEANGYKIFPEKLKWRISELEKLLLTEFKEVENRIDNEKIPLKFYYGENEGSVKYSISKSKESAKWMNFQLENYEIDKETALKVFEDEKGCHIMIKSSNANDSFEIKPEFNIMFPTVPLYIENGEFIIKAANSCSVPKDKVEFEMSKFNFEKSVNNGEFIYDICFDRKTLSMQENEPFRLAIWRKGQINSALLQAKNIFKEQLVRGVYSPEYYCFFIK